MSKPQTVGTKAYADEWAQSARIQGMHYDQVRALIQERATQGHPMYLGIVSSVNYLEKTDRYVIKFGSGPSTAKITNEAAQFLLCEAWPHGEQVARPTVYAHMTDGVIDSVLLLFVSRS